MLRNMRLIINAVGAHDVLLIMTEMAERKAAGHSALAGMRNFMHMSAGELCTFTLTQAL